MTPLVKVKELDLPPEQQASHLQRVMSFIQIIYDRYCSISTITTILFPDVDLCRSVVCGSESLSQLSSLGVFRVGCLDCGLSWAEIGPTKGMYSTFLSDLEFIFGFLSSNCYDKGTFNPPLLSLTPPQQKPQISFCYYFLFTLMAAMIDRWLKFGNYRLAKGCCTWLVKIYRLLSENL